MLRSDRFSRRTFLIGAAAAASVPTFRSTAAQQKATLSFGVSGADKGPLRDVGLHLANRMKELTQGRVTVDRFMGGTLGGEVQLGEAPRLRRGRHHPHRRLR